MKAQALSAKDYSPGLEGELHSGAAAKSCVNARADDGVGIHLYTLTEKQVLGSEGVVTPKATALRMRCIKASPKPVRWKRKDRWQNSAMCRHTSLFQQVER